MATQEPADIAAAFAHASLLHQQGRLKEAAPLYRRILLADPGHFDAHHMLGLLHAQQGEFLEAVKAIGHALKLNPRNQQALSNFGNVLRALGQRDEAVASYDAAISENQDDAVVWFNRGLLLAEMRRLPQAVASYERAIAIAPDHGEAMLACAAALGDMGRLEDALAASDGAIAVRPELAAAFNLRGTLLWRMGRPDAALDAFHSALSLAPVNAEFLNNRGLALTALERHEEALKSYDAALAARPGYVEALNNRGNALASLQRFDEALESHDKALTLRPGHPEALANRGASLVGLQRFEEALEAYAAALRHQPANGKAHYNRGVALGHMQRFSEALAEFETVLAAHPRHPHALSAAANAALNLCDWPKVKLFGERIARAVAENTAVIAPFTLLGYSDDTALHLICAKAWLAGIGAQCRGPWGEAVARGHQRLRIAYVSSDYGAHPVGYQLAALLERHDRSGFEIHGVSTGADDGSDIRSRLIGACDQFHDVHLMSDREAGALLRRLEIDIAVDLNGHTQYARPGLLAARPAPVQVGWLGYPSTTGLASMDYIIADAHVLPFAAQPHYSEMIVHLPDSYFAPGDPPPVALPPSRREEGLPADGVVFSCFNQSWKIGEALFDVWMRLLREVPESVLWLREHPPEVRARLEREAQSRGVDAGRLVWAKRASRERHLARLGLADLMLDTLPYNAHATASDALWAGVPVITCAGRTFAGRVASSLLHAAGLAELVTTTLADYESLALTLARSPEARAGLRERLARNREKAPFFDSTRHARMMEAAWRQMWRNAQNDAPPKGFALTLETAP
ncbi:MAG TPA: tetratricopeptide repeat protein [Rhizomicrobium sp.]|jgi:predicted O-linked N-acetylglucosamine transferase (SPINDLY family)|nr:tetratricopeptide repeat protein [Rhizomicrobium sp.]